MTGEARFPVWVRWAIGGTLAVLLGHAAIYRFLCDDSFISFRYADNFAHGAGLVFNPGFERVEGYTNFLWVVLLALFDRLGLRPEHVAPVASIALTIVLWALVARASLRWIPSAPWRVAAVFPCLFLALTRSVAVWSTSGLETRLFEVLVVAGVLRLIDHVDAVERGLTPRPWAAVLFGLAALTRPDGVLLGATAMAAAAALLASKSRLKISDAIGHAAVFAGIVGAHLIFRRVYYGEWVPNTYVAKVGGRSWWGMGAAYIGACVLEYAAWTWLPVIAAGVQAVWRERRAAVLIIVATIVPHALYVASIGGDHFEYRPLDLYFPLLFLLLGRGLAGLADGVLPRWGAAAYAAVIAIGLVALPWQSHRQFVREYEVGFPGLGATRGERLEFLDPSRDPLYRWPGLRIVAEAHRQLLRKLTSRLVGVRQEEHKLFLGTVLPEGKRLRALVEAGVLPADTHVAMSAVGAIPYFSRLRVLDRLGLTDAVVARSAPGDLRIMAHDKHATLEYAERAGVDLWTDHPVHLLVRLDDDQLVWRIDEARAARAPVYVAEAGDGETIVARLPQGIEKAAARFPRLAFRPVEDDAAYGEILDRVIEARRAELARDPGSRDAKVGLASALAARGQDDEALGLFRGLADRGDADGWYNLGTILARRGELEPGIDALRRAIAIDPTMGTARHNLGLALARSGRLGEAIVELREAARREPDSEGAIYTLGLALRAAGDAGGVTECAARLRALGTVSALGLADRLTAPGGPGSSP